jgi:DNA-binding LytR/AlgR family response regulator
MSKTIHALIVDDEELGRKNLQCAIEEHSNWTITGQASSVACARLELAAKDVDVVFLDIQMPRETGLQLALELSEKAIPPLIIFVTAFNEHAIEAFDLHALDYLLKPLDDMRLTLALKRAEIMLALKQQANYGKALRHYIDTESNHSRDSQKYWQQVSVRSIGKIETISLADVLWIEAQGNYMQLHTSSRAILYRASMASLEKHLDPNDFLRIHRSTIVRKNQISSIQVTADNSYKMLLQCDKVLPVSERYTARVKAALSQT